SSRGRLSSSASQPAASTSREPVPRPTRPSASRARRNSGEAFRVCMANPPVRAPDWRLGLEFPRGGRCVDYLPGNGRHDPAGLSCPAMNTAHHPVGALLRQWRQRRRLSQLELACEADISTRHLSFVETGRAQPSREMLLHLAEQLEIPLRERNRLLAAAGYAPLYSQHRLDDPALAAARAAIEQLLKAHEPYPALTIDR